MTKFNALLGLSLLSGFFASSAAFAGTDAALTNAFRGCVANSKLAKDEMTKPYLNCAGEEAKVLFQAVKKFAKSSSVSVDTDGKKKMVYFFGETSVPSQCGRALEDRSGNELNEYECALIFDLTLKVKDALDL